MLECNMAKEGDRGPGIPLDNGRLLCFQMLDSKLSISATCVSCIAKALHAVIPRVVVCYAQTGYKFKNQAGSTVIVPDAPPPADPLATLPTELLI